MMYENGSNSLFKRLFSPFVAVVVHSHAIYPPGFSCSVNRRYGFRAGAVFPFKGREEFSNSKPLESGEVKKWYSPRYY